MEFPTARKVVESSGEFSATYRTLVFSSWEPLVHQIMEFNLLQMKGLVLMMFLFSPLPWHFNSTKVSAKNMLFNPRHTFSLESGEK